MQRDRWHLGLLAREAVRNVFGPGARLFPVLAFAVLIGAGSSAFIAVESDAMRHETLALADRGRNVLVFSGLKEDEPSVIDRDSCERLATLDGVRRAGILEAAPEMNVLPVGTRLPVQRGSATLFPELSTADLLIGRNLSDRSDLAFNVRVGSEVAVAVQAGEYPADLGTGSSITLPLGPNDVTGRQCVVMLDEFADSAYALPAVAAQLHVAANPAAASELLIATSNPATDYLQRSGRWFPVLLGLVGSVIAAISNRLRASEIAVYRMSGTAPTSMMALLTFEALVIAGSSALAATAAAFAMFNHYIDPTVPILWGLVLAGVWTTASVIASIDLAVRRPSDLAKDR